MTARRGTEPERRWSIGLAGSQLRRPRWSAFPRPQPQRMTTPAPKRHTAKRCRYPIHRVTLTRENLPTAGLRPDGPDLRRRPGRSAGPALGCLPGGDGSHVRLSVRLRLRLVHPASAVTPTRPPSRGQHANRHRRVYTFDVLWALVRSSLRKVPPFRVPPIGSPQCRRLRRRRNGRSCCRGGARWTTSRRSVR